VVGVVVDEVEEVPVAPVVAVRESSDVDVPLADLVVAPEDDETESEVTLVATALAPGWS
jgi:hypothetical protein